MCPRTLSERHDQTETDRALWFFSTGSQRTNLNGGSVTEKSRFSDRGGHLAPPPRLIRVKQFLVDTVYLKASSLIFHTK